MAPQWTLVGNHMQEEDQPLLRRLIDRLIEMQGTRSVDKQARIVRNRQDVQQGFVERAAFMGNLR